jgi:hypothetical protein
MTGGLGFTTQMQSSGRQNRKLQHHTDSVRRKKDDLEYLHASQNLKFKADDLKVVAEIKERCKKEKRKERIRIGLIFFVLLLLILLLVIKFL